MNRADIVSTAQTGRQGDRQAGRETDRQAATYRQTATQTVSQASFTVPYAVSTICQSGDSCVAAAVHSSIPLEAQIKAAVQAEDYMEAARLKQQLQAASASSEAKVANH